MGWLKWTKMEILISPRGLNRGFTVYIARKIYKIKDNSCFSHFLLRNFDFVNTPLFLKKMIFHTTMMEIYPEFRKFQYKMNAKKNIFMLLKHIILTLKMPIYGQIL